MRRGLVLLGLCGCDALFGLDTLSSPDAPDAQPDVAPGRMRVMGQITRRWLHEDAANTPVFETELYPATSPLSVRLSDGTTAPMTWEPTGAFTFEAAEGERYAVIVPGFGYVSEFQMSTPVLTLDETRLGHPDQSPPGPAASVDWTTATTTIPASELLFAATGIWSVTQPVATATPGKYSVTWPTANFFSGQTPATLRASAHDWLYTLHYTSNTTVTPNTRLLDQYSAHGMVTTNPNGASSFSSNLGPVSRPYCEDVYWTHARDTARLSQLYPQFSMPGGDTRISGVAAAEQIGFRTNYELSLVFSNATDGFYRFQYGNPFGLDVVVLDNVYVKRMLGTIPINVNMQYFDLITPSMTCARHDNPPQPPVITATTLDGVPLVDNLVLANNGSKPIDLSWTLDPADAVVTTQVNLLKINGPIRVYNTVDNHVYIDPRDMDSGAQYRLQVIANRGHFPNAASGDWLTRVYPHALLFYSSGLFSISKP